VDAYQAIYGIDEAVLIAKMAAVTQRRTLPKQHRWIAPRYSRSFFKIIAEICGRTICERARHRTGVSEISTQPQRDTETKGAPIRYLPRWTATCMVRYRRHID
jgi:hypothetical protein